jgi:hypothetical protein
MPPLFIVGIHLNNPLRIGGTAGIQAHLEVLVIHFNPMKGKFQIGEDAQPPFSPGKVFQLDIPELHRVVPRNKQGLFGGNTPIKALVGAVGKALAANVTPLIQVLTHGLPGYAPVFSGIVVPDIHVMTGSVHRHPIGAEPGNPMIFWGFIEEIASGGMIKHPAEVLHPNIICPGYGHVNPVDYILPVFRIKITITHSL